MKKYLLIIPLFISLSVPADSSSVFWVPNNYLDAERWHYLRSLEMYPVNTSFLTMKYYITPFLEISPGHKTDISFYSQGFIIPSAWYHTFAVRWDLLKKGRYKIPVKN